MDPATGEVFAAIRTSASKAGSTSTRWPRRNPAARRRPNFPITAPTNSSPRPNKHGSAVDPIGDFGVDQAAEDGEAITYTSSGPIVAHPAADRWPEPAVNLSRRGSAGWETQDLATPRGPVPIGYKNEGPEYRYFSAELDQAFLQPALGYYVRNEVVLSPNATETTLYRRNIGERRRMPAAALELLPGARLRRRHDQRSVRRPAPVLGLQRGRQPRGVRLRSRAAAGRQRGRIAAAVRVEPLGQPPSPAGKKAAPCSWSASCRRWKGRRTARRRSAESSSGACSGPNTTAPNRKNGDIRHAISDNGNRVIWSIERREPTSATWPGAKPCASTRPKQGWTPNAAVPQFQTASADG